MCDQKILTPWPGHIEVCSGYSHSYVEEMQSVLFPGKRGSMRVTPGMFGETLDGTFHALCPNPAPLLNPNTTAPWEVYEDRDTIARRRLVDGYFIHREQTFDNYKIEFNGHDKDVVEIHHFMRVDHLNRLILKGDVGRGKSHLAMACVNQFGHGAVMFSSSSFYQMLRETESFEPDEFAMKAMDRLKYSKLIAIDDLGVEKQTDTQVFNLGLKELLESFTGKLIITTNLSEKDMENIYGQKIVSRIYDNAIMIVLKGKDYRRSK